ncbi:MAG: malonyl-ACP O-methyltransferase BioC [Nitrospinales bacterium]
MKHQFNKRHVRQHFDQAASSFDQAAVVQRWSANFLLDWSAALEEPPSVVVDIGCGTGYSGSGLRGLYPHSSLISLDISLAMLEQARQMVPGSANVEDLPLRRRCVDLFFSNAALQWCNDLEKTLGSLKEALKPGGRFMFSTYGPETLKEIRLAWEKVDPQPETHVSDFLSSNKLSKVLSKARLEICALETKRYQVFFESPWTALESVRRVGAKNAASRRQRGMTGRKRFTRFLSGLEGQRVEAGIPLTYDVMFAHVRNRETH